LFKNWFNSAQECTLKASKNAQIVKETDKSWKSKIGAKLVKDKKWKKYKNNCKLQSNREYQTTTTTSSLDKVTN
jgi:hypothetical protein